ncbi:MAG: zinc-ribbon domain-containing protein [bacterium]
MVDSNEVTSKYCSSCGYENPINARYCLKCGKKLIVPTLLEDPECEKGIYCPRCGKRSPEGSNFCMWCGNEFSVRPSNVKEIFCARCGKPNEPDARFCFACKYDFIVLFKERSIKIKASRVAVHFPIIHLSPLSEYPDTAQLIVHGRHKRWFYLFAKPQIMVGRDRKNDIVLRLLPYKGEAPDVEENIEKTRHISRVHFMITSDASGIWITNYSMNGTLWNDELITKGDKLQILDDGIISIKGVIDLKCSFIGRKGEEADGLLIQRVNNLTEEGYVLFYKELLIGGEDGLNIGDYKTNKNSARIVCNGKRYMLECANGEIIINDDTKLTPHDKPYELPQTSSEPLSSRFGDVLIEFRMRPYTLPELETDKKNDKGTP